MEIELPHVVVYETPRTVPVADVIDSLRGALAITAEIGPVLENLIPG